jgi:cytochrome P450
MLRNPKNLSVLTHEIRHSFKNAADITMTSSEKLIYFKACMSETFRVYPPIVGTLPRIVPTGGAFISRRYVPENTTVGVCHWAVYRSAKNFSNPDSFKPERWLDDCPEEFANDDREALQPFSVGPRSCIAKQ